MIKIMNCLKNQKRINAVNHNVRALNYGSDISIRFQANMNKM